ncbi:MAG: hypothetical protein RIQ61_1606 [Bacteroidota bacterium]|jgi:hypothetical protein
MNNFKNIIKEKYKDYFIKQNPQFTIEHEETIAFCNEQLKKYYEPYITYVENKKKRSIEIEAELNNINKNELNDSRDWIMAVASLCMHSIFCLRPSLNKYTDKITGFKEIRFYFNLHEFEYSTIPFLEFNLDISFIDLIKALEFNRQLKLYEAILKTVNVDRDKLKSIFYNLKEKRKYNAKRPRKKEKNEIMLEMLEELTTEKYKLSKLEYIESLYKESRSVVKSEIGIGILRNILNQIIEKQKTNKEFSQSKLFESIQEYIFLLFNNDQLGIKSKTVFEEGNSRTIKEEYDFNYKKYYNSRIRSLIFKI